MDRGQARQTMAVALLALVLALPGAALAQGVSNPKAGILLGSAAVTPLSAAVRGAGEPLRGFYVFGHEVRTLQPCGSEAVYWIRADEPIRDRLREASRELATAPYEEHYLVAWGGTRGEPREGFAAGYDGQVVMKAIVVVRAKQEVHCRPTARPDELYVADLGVVCNRQREVCYDHAGASIGLTGLFGGAEAAARLTASLRAPDPAALDRSRFAPADGVECHLAKRTCRVDGKVDPLLGRTLFPASRRRRPAQRAARYRKLHPGSGARYATGLTRFNDVAGEASNRDDPKPTGEER